MGYRVGMNCFDTRLQADDYLLSSLPPTVTEEGKIIRPERVGDKWILNGKPVTLSYPKCSNYEQVKSRSLSRVYGFNSVCRYLRLQAAD
ncbi:hypothetical protein DE8555_1713 [Neisseria meningitidis]|uniref:Uncharacterized protein n=1 Tax=Neisseria meningitidis TaxID=487 RepID=A0AAC9GDJ7_NEIME|nr:hypothetical protein DE8555_1713 [Neisseria meningitidis]